jgi:hypothetical protein
MIVQNVGLNVSETCLEYLEVSVFSWLSIGYFQLGLVWSCGPALSMNRWTWLIGSVDGPFIEG